MLRVFSVVCILVLLQGCSSAGGMKKINFINSDKIEVPEIISNTDWVRGYSTILAQTSDQVLDVAIGYRHPKYPWHLSVRTILNQEVLKIYDIRNDRDNILERWYLLKKDGKWNLIKSMRSRTLYEDSTITIFVEDIDGNVLLSETYRRK
jgi:hypothetical protein